MQYVLGVNLEGEACFYRLCRNDLIRFSGRLPLVTVCRQDYICHSLHVWLSSIEQIQSINFQF